MPNSQKFPFDSGRGEQEDDDLLSLAWPPPNDGDVKVVDLDEPSVESHADADNVFREEEVRLIEPQADDAPRAANFSEKAANFGDKFGASLTTLADRVRWPRSINVGGLAVPVLAMVIIAETAFIASSALRPAANDATGRAAATAPLTSPGDRSTASSGTLGSSPQRATGTTGRLVVSTTPAGAAVAVDGLRLGAAPVVVPKLKAGTHTVTVRSARATVEQQVRIAAGQETSLVVPLGAGKVPSTTTPASPAQGWLSVNAPVELRIFEGDSLIGTSSMRRIPLKAGRHELAFHHESTGYLETKTVNVAAGKALALDVRMPMQRVAINAIPWADVWVDGVHIGETPIGAVTVAAGLHTIVFRNPEFGERSVQTVVTVAKPARVSIDMRQ